MRLSRPGGKKKKATLPGEENVAFIKAPQKPLRPCP
jgi:hypothetical protein